MSKQTKTTKSKKSDLTRTQKERAAKNYSAYLKQIAKASQFWQNNITPLDKIQQLEKMNKTGIISNYELEYMGNMLLWLEVFRLINERYGKAEPKENKYDIDTSKLIAGMSIPNYRSLCRLLGEKPTTGDAINSQKKRWSNYFDFAENKYSNEIIILEVYDEPMTPEERKYRKAAFINELKVLILEKLNRLDTNSKGNIVYCTTYKQLIYEMDLVDPCLTDKQYKFDIDDFLFDFLKRKLGNTLTDGQIKFNFAIFKENTLEKIRDGIDSALKALRHDNMIAFSGQFILATRDRESGTTIYTEADDNQTAIITQTQKDVSKELGYRNSHDACKFAKKKYYQLFDTIISQRLNCDYCYHRLKIVTSKANIERHIDEYTALSDSRSVAELTFDNIKDFDLTYNQNLTKALRLQGDNIQQSKANSFLKRLQKNSPEFTLEDLALLVDPLSKPDIARYDDSFREMYSRLIDLFVDKSSVDDDLNALHRDLNEIQEELEQEAIDFDKQFGIKKVNTALKNDDN